MSVPCHDFSSELFGEGHPSRATLEHLRTCLRCRRDHEQARQHSGALQSWVRRQRSGSEDRLWRQVRRQQQRLLSRQLVRYAQGLLLLQREFERAFPAEDPEQFSLPLLSRSVATLAAGTGEVQRWTALCAPLSGTLAACLERVDALLEAALEVDAELAEPYLARAQRNWVFGPDATVRPDLVRALQHSRSPGRTGCVLLHLAIWHADAGELAPALALLRQAVEMAPASLAIRYTLGVYAAAAGARHEARQQLAAAGTLGRPQERLQRLVQLPCYLQRLAELGAGTPGRTRVTVQALEQWFVPGSSSEAMNAWA